MQTDYRLMMAIREFDLARQSHRLLPRRVSNRRQPLAVHWRKRYAAYLAAAAIIASISMIR